MEGFRGRKTTKNRAPKWPADFEAGTKRCQNDLCCHGLDPLPITKFYQSNQWNDGLEVYCKTCRSAKKKQREKEIAKANTQSLVGKAVDVLDGVAKVPAKKRQKALGDANQMLENLIYAFGGEWAFANEFAKTARDSNPATKLRAMQALITLSRDMTALNKDQFRDLSNEDEATIDQMIEEKLAALQKREVPVDVEYEVLDASDIEQEARELDE